MSPSLQALNEKNKKVLVIHKSFNLTNIFIKHSKFYFCLDNYSMQLNNYYLNGSGDGAARHRSALCSTEPCRVIAHHNKKLRFSLKLLIILYLWMMANWSRKDFSPLPVVSNSLSDSSTINHSTFLRLTD